MGVVVRAGFLGVVGLAVLVVVLLLVDFLEVLGGVLEVQVLGGALHVVGVLHVVVLVFLGVVLEGGLVVLVEVVVIGRRQIGEEIM